VTTLPRLYAIVDAGVLLARDVTLSAYANELRAAGVTLLQYRDKGAGPQTVLRNAALIAEVCAGSVATLILNDRSDLAALAGWDGVHVGQTDLSPEDAKAVLMSSGLGGSPTHRKEQELDAWGTRTTPWKGPTSQSRDVGHPPSTRGIVGVSTHTVDQVIAAEAGVADYVAIGPVFATGTKLDAAAVVGLEGVRRARVLTRKPLVAIGGITRENARSVIEAGADSVVVISGLFVQGETVENVARDFLEILR
jgi:thiamine-phosphate pyrophosphorylase